MQRSPVGHGQYYDDPYFEWEDFGEIDESGAIQVRPERFMAFRSKMLDTDREATLLAAWRM